jgi:ADP-heptose:LPS heptosyltransferase
MQKPPVRRVLVTRLRFMGDVILTTPVLHALRRADPECKIGYLSEKRYSVLLDGHPDVDWNFRLERGWKEFLSMIRNLRAKRFDAVVDLFGNPRSAWIVWLSGAGCRIGGDHRGRKYFYTKRIPDDGIVRSAIDYHLRFLEPLGIQALPSSTRIVLRDSELMDAERLLADFGYRKKPGRPLVGINPGATWPAKRIGRPVGC